MLAQLQAAHRRDAAGGDALSDGVGDRVRRLLAGEVDRVPARSERGGQVDLRLCRAGPLPVGQDVQDPERAHAALHASCTSPSGPTQSTRRSRERAQTAANSSRELRPSAPRDAAT